MLVARCSSILLFVPLFLQAQFAAQDPGLRERPRGAGQALSNLTGFERLFFEAGQDDFREIQSVRGKTPGASGVGLGPRFNLDSCSGCHAHPAVGGSSPPVNPQIATAAKSGATNSIPGFLRVDGPVREARLKFHPDGSRDGGVYEIFTITGRVDAPGCLLDQPDLGAAASADNLSLRIPTPLFGAGLLEAIPDSVILANKDSNREAKLAAGIAGHENRNSGGPIGRFGWKAQHHSLLLFTAEAYNVEQGVTNELFPSERDETAGCLFNSTPEDHTKSDPLNLGSILGTAVKPTDVTSDIVKLAAFVRLLAPPTPIPATRSTANGATLFSAVGCAFCHTPILTTGDSSSAARANKTVNLFSDLLVHHMGPGLADDVVQGDAGPDEFRTAPLWGLGQRLFFLHDGRTSDLLSAIRSHASPGDSRFQSSEANIVLTRFESLSEQSKQDLLNFLRAL